ncbi:MAG: hypothetical protein ABWY57_07260 [Mycetocola sp.]
MTRFDRRLFVASRADGVTLIVRRITAARTRPPLPAGSLSLGPVGDDVTAPRWIRAESTAVNRVLSNRSAAIASSSPLVSPVPRAIQVLADRERDGEVEFVPTDLAVTGIARLTA